MAKEVYRVEIPIEATDNYSSTIRQAERHTTQFEKKIERTVSRVNKRLNDLTNGRWSMTINAVDRASRVVSRVSSYVHRVANRSYRFTLRAYDMATRTIGGVRRAITSIPALVTITLGVIGAGKLKEATVGAAMSFEQYEVSMTHWLNGNQKKAKDLVKWMGKFADTTPFSSVDLFPALTRGLGVSNGDVKQAQDLLKLSADMAALTPGKTVSDAMESLADAQMGEMERLKEFNVKVSKKEFDKMGYAGVVEQLAKKFDGGARKLSETSAGIISTLKGYRSSLFRAMGTGFLEPMKPRLDAINNWLANNQETWGKWKDTVSRHGEQASEFIFSNLEKGFGFIRSRYLDNKEFMDLSFKGKIDFVLGDINEWWSSKGKTGLDSWWESSGKPWAAKTGLTIGEAIFEGIKTGLTKGLETLGELWGNVGTSVKDNGVFSKETATSVGGAGVATLGAGVIGAALLSPLIRTVATVGKVAKQTGGGALRGGAYVYDTISGKKGKPSGDSPKGGSTTTKTRTVGTPRKRDAYSETMKRMNSPKEMPKSFWSKLTGGGNKILKRIPFLGTALGALSIASASKEDRPGVIGGVAGGLAGMKGGAVAGAAIGSVVPGVGTAAGGAIGGIVGGIGGAIGGEWLGSNWDTIKSKASEASEYVKDKWSGISSWFQDSVWTPVSNGAINSVNFFAGVYGFAKDSVQQIWGPVSSWFQETVWSPISTGAGIAGQWIGDRLSEGWGLVEAVWGVAAGWFEETIWAPISTGASVVGSWIGERFTEGYGVVQGAWGAASGWFEENVWSPLRSGVEAVASWFSEKLDVLKTGAASIGNIISEKTSLVKKGVEAGYNVITRRGEQETGLKPTKAYANGGQINRPHVGLVGEAGPEMIIPLSSGRRNRAMDLFNQTAIMLGVKPYAQGGIGGSVPNTLINSPSNGRSNTFTERMQERFQQTKQLVKQYVVPEPIVPGYGDSAPAMAIAGTMGGTVRGGQSAIHVSAPITVEFNGEGAQIDEKTVKDIVTKYGREFVEKLREALNNRSR